MNIALTNTKWLWWSGVEVVVVAVGCGVVVEPACLSDSQVFLWHEIEKD